MLKLGLKVGLTDWQEKFNKLREFPAFVEVYFKTDFVADYQYLFKYLRQNQIKTRLHLWVLVDNMYFPSIAVGDALFVQKSLDLIFKNIQIAQENNFQAVVFHVGQNRLVKFDFITKAYQPIGRSSVKSKYESNILDSMQKIIDYGAKLNVLPLIENECFTQLSSWDQVMKRSGLTHELAGDDIEPEIFVKIAQLGQNICLDIAHLSTWCDRIKPKSRQDRFVELCRLIKLISPGVGGLHAGSILPPYRTDSDSAFMPDELEEGAFPNIKELTKILSIFHKAPQEIMIVGEPRAEDHVETYHLLKDIIEKVGRM